ncbi:putative GPI-anchored cell surface glycoprotein [Aspergillus undulatus]|uniref:putative GPI-anchored cell surface glycoprotein n=1 Tax=Aspergillus undulatus TaxID=1810928 RepID=UPI003CCDDB74
MSLNGLDSPPVIEAYQIALIEAGGWFLLRYVSRDEIALHERGTGGVPDVRNAIEGYEESSPLYGFLQYRRRKVVLSYLPEDLSRLVRARATVQFQSVLDKFSPHDTVFSLSQPSELTESALSSACLLHTASGSITSSSNSLRRRRLLEIAEDAEESPAKDPAQAQAPGQDSRQRSFSQVSEATIVPPSVAETAPTALHDDISTPTSPDAQANALSPTISVDHHSERPASSKNLRDDLSLAPSETRQSTQSARPSLQDLERAAGFKPKVKLGPRPSIDGSGRPRTAGNLARSVEQRPVASLPAGVRASPFRKSNPSLARPRSQGNPVAAPSARVPPVPPLLVPPSSMPISRPQLSPGAKSLSAISTASTSNEKERLMKALQLRKTQMQKRTQEAKRAEAAVEESNNSTQDLDDDKENFGLHSEKLKYDKGPQRLSSISEHDNKGPLTSTQLQPETQQPATPEPASDQDQEDTTPDSSKEDLVVETDSGQTGYTLPSTTYSPEDSESNNLGNALESPLSPSPETGPVQEDLTGSTATGISCGTVSPSAVVDVPPEDHPEKIPEEEEIITTPSPAEEETPITKENKVDLTTEPTETVQPQPEPLHESPVLDSLSDFVTDTPTITASDLVDSQDAPASETINKEQQNPTTRKDKRRPPALEPIQVPTPDYSDDDNLLSDDDFMEELKSATVEEAKPISVGKSPLSPGYSNGGNEQGSPDAWRNSRAVSNPSATKHQFSNSPIATSRSVSSPFSPAENSTGPVLVAKKINVSSGISKRIKALEQFSSREGAVTPTPSASTPSALLLGTPQQSLLQTTVVRAARQSLPPDHLNHRQLIFNVQRVGCLCLPEMTAISSRDRPARLRHPPPRKRRSPAPPDFFAVCPRSLRPRGEVPAVRRIQQPRMTVCRPWKRDPSLRWPQSILAKSMSNSLTPSSGNDDLSELTTKAT